MWEKILAVNSFVIWPLTGIFFVYAIGRTIFAFEWKMLVLATILVLLSTFAGVIIGIIAES